MGREWLYWVGGGGGRKRRVREDEGASSAGCMCAVFQLFDLHQFQLPLNHQHSFDLNPDAPFLQQEATTSKGVEAPRNSLEIEEPAAMKAASKPLAMDEEEQNLNFPVGINQIKTRLSISSSKSRTEDFQSDCSTSSPGTKTPNLVARLMGLDLLPESTSPSFSCPNSNPHTKSHLTQKRYTSILLTRSNTCFYNDDISVGARSLPETPRISSARRSDVEYHRLSLQINKENINEEVMKIGGRRGRFRQDENRSSSPRHYAKKIVKQVKESVSKRVGLTDVTNTNREREEIRRDQNLLLLKFNKKNPTKLDNETTQSCSPKPFRFLDTKKSKPAADLGVRSPRNSASSDSSLKPKNQVVVQEQEQKTECKKVNFMKNKKEETFVRAPAANKVKLIDKKSKKAPLSSELLHISGPTLLPVKKGPSPPATKLPQKQSQVSSDALSSKRNTQLSSNTRQSYKPLHKQPDKIFAVPENVLPDSTNGCATAPSTSAAPDHRWYIQKILKRAGINDKFTPLTLGKWHAPSHPLDPSIFYYLELFHPTSAAAVLSRRWNRKLIFQLVDELLAEILKPHLDFKPWVSPIVRKDDHLGLDEELCKKIESFPAANCQVLEDIDSLIDKDLCKSALNVYYEEDGENLVREIEGEIMERLVSETVVAMVGGRTDEGRRQIRWMSRGDSRDEMPLVGVWRNHPRG